MVKLTKAQQSKQKSLYSKMVTPKRKYASMMTIQAEHMPELKDMEVGKEYEVKLKAKLIEKSEGGYDGKQPLKGCFKTGDGSEYGEAYYDEDD